MPDPLSRYPRPPVPQRIRTGTERLYDSFIITTPDTRGRPEGSPEGVLVGVGSAVHYPIPIHLQAAAKILAMQGAAYEWLENWRRHAEPADLSGVGGFDGGIVIDGVRTFSRTFRANGILGTSASAANAAGLGG